MVMSDKALEHARANSLVRGDRTTSMGNANSSLEYIVLTDGSLFVLKRNNLAAAKELLAAQKSVEHRISGS